MEQMHIRGLPIGTTAALRARAQRHGRSLEAEVRMLIAEALKTEPVTLVDILATDEGADIDFEPDRLRLTTRVPKV